MYGLVTWILTKQFVRNGGGWNWLRIVPKWRAAVSVAVKLLVLVPESQLFTMTDSWERAPEEERWMELGQDRVQCWVLVTAVFKLPVLLPDLVN
jgi:hypothetical protein